MNFDHGIPRSYSLACVHAMQPEIEFTKTLSTCYSMPITVTCMAMMLNILY